MDYIQTTSATVAGTRKRSSTTNTSPNQRRKRQSTSGSTRSIPIHTTGTSQMLWMWPTRSHSTGLSRKSLEEACHKCSTIGVPRGARGGKAATSHLQASDRGTYHTGSDPGQETHIHDRYRSNIFLYWERRLSPPPITIFHKDYWLLWDETNNAINRACAYDN